MAYDMTVQINEIAKLEGKTNREIAEKLEIDFTDTKFVRVDGKLKTVKRAEDEVEFIAWNRREEGRVLAALEDTKNKIAQQKIDEKRAAGFRWLKEDGEWVAAGNLSKKKIGDKIITIRADGQESVKEIVGFSELGNAIVQ